MACAVILATGTVENCTSFLDMEPQGIRPYPPTHPQSFDFMSATMLIKCICIKDMTGSCRLGFNSQRQCKVYQPVHNKREKGAKKKFLRSWILSINFL
jgi:hypothetical protein